MNVVLPMHREDRVPKGQRIVRVDPQLVAQVSRITGSRDDDGDIATLQILDAERLKVLQARDARHRQYRV